MGFIIGMVTAVVGAVKTVASCAGAIGGAISKLGTGIVNIANKISGLDVGSFLSSIGKVIHGIAQFLGICSDEPEELGAKVQQCEKTVDDFDGDVEAYIKYLKEEVELDKEKFNQMKPEEKMACKAVGLSLEAKAIEKNLDGVEITPESLALLGKAEMKGVKIDPEELVKVVKSLKSVGITDLNDIVNYFEGKGSNRMETGKALEGILGKGADDKINQWKDAARSFE